MPSYLKLTTLTFTAKFASDRIDPDMFVYIPRTEYKQLQTSHLLHNFNTVS
jgi:hypothetical protein